MELNPRLILIVEDDAGDRVLIRRALAEGDFGRELATVSNGEEALHYLQRQEGYATLQGTPLPSLIILDLNLPKVSGKQVLEAMTGDPVLANIPVVIFTTSDQEQDVDEAYAHGAWYYLVKPSGAAGYGRMVAVLRRFWQHLGGNPII